MFEQVLEEIKKYDRIILHRHTNPDGDALGSQIGLKHILTENFPHKQVRMVGDEARRYSFMDTPARFSKIRSSAMDRELKYCPHRTTKQTGNSKPLDL